MSPPKLKKLSLQKSICISSPGNILLCNWSEEKGEKPEEVYINKKTRELTCVDEIGHPEGIYSHFNDWDLKTIRPQECIDKYGL